jgi:hypothetical protein
MCCRCLFWPALILLANEGIHNTMTDEHACTYSGRRKTTTPTTFWVASLALSILTKKPHMDAKEL